ncbi:hypothetical protein DFA_06063 [Cavenderia fasciculata]|uniref:Uncharacterized protein n=1 Tax=Cavenderia fasciculata TaxID=261658 RepID=F4PK01_CACFS|nr:uncharacterized protein DFA_06063 [Cavenderia fasciculata]EGG23925.1 hypothetical protein DFA_06063 [Cavenderia fasciculata]|eukprot:XP_004361776.1 hypothetical protein DFA_06063 [Cavenderia fasciculata]
MTTTTSLQYEERVKNVLHYNIYLRKLVYSFVIKLNDVDYNRQTGLPLKRGTINSIIACPINICRMFDDFLGDRETTLLCYLLAKTSFRFGTDDLVWYYVVRMVTASNKSDTMAPRILESLYKQNYRSLDNIGYSCRKRLFDLHANSNPLEHVIAMSTNQLALTSDLKGKHWVDMESFITYANHFRLDVLQYFNERVTDYSDITTTDLDKQINVAIIKCGRWDIIEQLIIARMIPNQLFLELCLCKRMKEIERILLNHPHLEYLDSFMSNEYTIRSICQLQDTQLIDILSNHLTMFDKFINTTPITQSFLMNRVDAYLVDYHKHDRTYNQNPNATSTFNSFNHQQDLLQHHTKLTNDQSKLMFDDESIGNNNKFTFF